MTEYAHNHPPTCCCDLSALHTPDRGDPDICPLCPEHGELAQLGNNNSPKTIQAHTGERIYACCNQLVGRPHTDYCPTRCGNTSLANQQPYSGDPNPLGTPIEPTHHANGQDMHPRHECHPDRCGMWATQTTQPATVTSTPTTQTRASDLAYCGQRHPTAGHYCARPADPAHTEHWTHDQRGWSTADSEPTPHATPTPCLACAEPPDSTPTTPHTCW